MPKGDTNQDNELQRLDEEAERRFSVYGKIDPFPEVPAALLNSAHIRRYIQTTGMVCPFHEDGLKSASYEARIKGLCRYWDADGNPHEKTLEKETDVFVLKPNSIAFIEIEPKFRLPDYIALRFNLKITHVYRGLLLGTGPLIDPGYEGKIFIPLHNLTSNTYTFEGLEGLIWIEFTKTTSTNAPISEESAESIEKADLGSYKPFPNNKKNMGLDYFIHKATQGKGVISSIPRAINLAQKKAEEARGFSRNTFVATAIGLALAAAGAGTLFYNSWDLQREYVTGIANGMVEKRVLEERIISLRDKTSTETHKMLDEHKNELLRLIERQEKKIKLLEEKINNSAADSKK